MQRCQALTEGMCTTGITTVKRPPTYDNVYFISETFQGFLDCLQFHDPLAEVDHDDG